MVTVFFTDEEIRLSYLFCSKPHIWVVGEKVRLVKLPSSSRSYQEERAWDELVEATGSTQLLILPIS